MSVAELNPRSQTRVSDALARADTGERFSREAEGLPVGEMARLVTKAVISRLTL